MLGDVFRLNGDVGFATRVESEVDMAAAECVLETLADVGHHLKLLAAATGVAEIVGATRSYLANWSKARIENLQKIDGGWGTFDSRLQPVPVRGVADIVRISDALSGHCRALKNARIEPTPELLELDLYFALAKQAAEKFMSGGRQPYTASSRNTGYRHWSDKDAVAA
jgi:hypothetical protein